MTSLIREEATFRMEFEVGGVLALTILAAILAFSGFLFMDNCLEMIFRFVIGGLGVLFGVCYLVASHCFN